MKTNLYFLVLLYSTVISSQIKIGPDAAEVSAALTVNSTEKGVLYPRMSSVDRLAIVNPTVGLQVYDINEECLMIYRNNVWDCYAGKQKLTSRIAAILMFDNITDIDGADNAEKASEGVTIIYNPDGVVQDQGSGIIRFLKYGKYEISLTGTISRTSGINVLSQVSFESLCCLQAAGAWRESPGSVPSDNNFFGRSVLDIVPSFFFQPNEFIFSYYKLSQGTPNTTTISVQNPMVIIKYVDLY